LLINGRRPLGESNGGLLRCCRQYQHLNSPDTLGPAPIHDTKYCGRRREESLISCLSPNNETPHVVSYGNWDTVIVQARSSEAAMCEPFPGVRAGFLKNAGDLRGSLKARLQQHQRLRAGEAHRDVGCARRQR
jgi:hypothetical protein